jgi:hypothetical protein
MDQNLFHQGAQRAERNMRVLDALRAPTMIKSFPIDRLILDDR